MRQNVTILKFNTVQDLIDFQKIIGVGKGEIDIDHCTLTWTFGDAEIELAEAGYQATILGDRHESLTKSGH